MNIGIRVQNLGGLPSSQVVVVRVPEYAFLDGDRGSARGRLWPAAGHCPGRRLVGPDEGGAELVEADVQVGPETRRAEPVHGVLEREAGARGTRAAQLGTVK